MPRRKLRCGFYTGFFTFAHLLITFSIASAMETTRSAEVVGQTESEALRIALAALNFALDHRGAYPQSMAELPRQHPVGGSWNGVPNMSEGLDDQTIADESHFAYFGSGLTDSSPKGIVVVASTKNLPDGGHLLYTNDDQEIWVGPTGFAHVQPYLKNHVPVSEWKN